MKKTISILITTILCLSAQAKNQSYESIKIAVVSAFNQQYGQNISFDISSDEASKIGLTVNPEKAFLVHKVSLDLGGRGVGIYTAAGINNLQDAIDVVANSVIGQ